LHDEDRDEGVKRRQAAGAVPWRAEYVWKRTRADLVPAEIEVRIA